MDYQVDIFNYRVIAGYGFLKLFHTARLEYFHSEEIV